MSKVRKFVRDNIVAIVIVPTIVAIHWGCNKIQQIDAFVSEEERKELPIVLAGRYLKGEIVSKYNTLWEDKKAS